MRTCENDSRRHHQFEIPLTPAAAQHSIAPSCTCLPPQLKESSAIGRAAALTSSSVAASSTRLSLPTSQLTASDLRVGVGPHPPTRNRTQQQASKQATCCHHTARAPFTTRPTRYADLALDLPCLFRPPGLSILPIDTLHCLLFCLPPLHNTF